MAAQCGTAVARLQTTSAPAGTRESRPRGGGRASLDGGAATPRAQAPPPVRAGARVALEEERGAQRRAAGAVCPRDRTVRAVALAASMPTAIRATARAAAMELED